jgi:hypothetical protein
MVAKLVALASSLAVAAAQTSSLLWEQHDDVAVFTSSSIALQSGTTPTFATATW